LLVIFEWISDATNFRTPGSLSHCDTSRGSLGGIAAPLEIRPDDVQVIANPRDGSPLVARDFPVLGEAVHRRDSP
jgi:hypothetical protein